MEKSRKAKLIEGGGILMIRFDLSDKRCQLSVDTAALRAECPPLCRRELISPSKEDNTSMQMKHKPHHKEKGRCDPWKVFQSGGSNRAYAAPMSYTKGKLWSKNSIWETS